MYHYHRHQIILVRLVLLVVDRLDKKVEVLIQSEVLHLLLHHHYYPARLLKRHQRHHHHLQR